jgi:inositol oxygenase
MDIWEILEDLNSLTDVSDQDCFHPNLYHAVQTVEMIRKDGHPEWMQLIGLLHNVRKIMYKKNVMMKVLWKNNGQS